MKKICIGCSEEYETKFKDQQYCSRQCRKTSTKVIVTCLNCGKTFQDQRSAHTKYCSISCGLTARNLTDKNPAYTRDVTGDKNPMYGKGLRGVLNGMFGRRKELSSQWKGGRKVRKDGYILVIAPDDHPHPSDQNGKTKYILEHRLVMEKEIGRYLEPQEVVHHIDENPSNNNINNLRLYKNQRDHIKFGHQRH